MNKSKKSRKAGFTLAEVLITLGIIGVVAALTLPTLIKNYQKQVWVNQLKKAYSTLGNAFNKMAADEGVVDWKQTYCGENINGTSDFYNNKDELSEECFSRIFKQFNVVKKKAYTEPCHDEWCKAGMDTDEEGNVLWTPPELFDSSMCGEIVTADGFTYYFVPVGYSPRDIDIFVDINSRAKGPNITGRDIFLFYADLNKGRILPFDWYGNAQCTANSFDYGCTEQVLREGKMDY